MSMRERFLARPVMISSKNLVELKTEIRSDTVTFTVPKRWLESHLSRRGVNLMKFVTSYSFIESLHLYNEANQLGIIVSELYESDVPFGFPSDR